MNTLITQIREHLSNGKTAFWKSRRISNIKLDTLNIGGKLKIRLDGFKRDIEIDIEEISFN